MLSPWDLELRLWLEGADAFADSMAHEAIMAFGPTGILANGEIVESLRSAPRWSEIDMTEKMQSRPLAGVSVLGYRARARRDGAEPYEALCTSTYVLVDGYWWIIQHQQTPIELVFI